MIMIMRPNMLSAQSHILSLDSGSSNGRDPKPLLGPGYDVENLEVKSHEQWRTKHTLGFCDFRRSISRFRRGSASTKPVDAAAQSRRCRMGRRSSESAKLMLFVTCLVS